MYDLRNQSHLVSFARDCRNAIGECRPGVNYRTADTIELEILKGKLTAEDIFNEFDSCDILWKYGYSRHLSKDSKDVFYHVKKLKNNAVKKLFL